MNNIWICQRCGLVVDYKNKRCGCAVSPSPWAPLDPNTTLECSECGELVDTTNNCCGCGGYSNPNQWIPIERDDVEKFKAIVVKKDKRQKYVLGFVFDSKTERVLLIKKNKSPEGLNGKMIGMLNGLGGKVETTDKSVHHAISREVKEECDLYIPPTEWVNYCDLNFKYGKIYCFYAIVDTFCKVERGNWGIFTHKLVSIYKQMESEPVGDYWVKSAEDYNGSHGDYTGIDHMANLEYLIPMALNHYKKLDSAPKFEVSEIYEN